MDCTNYVNERNLNLLESLILDSEDDDCPTHELHQCFLELKEVYNGNLEIIKANYNAELKKREKTRSNKTIWNLIEGNKVVTSGTVKNIAVYLGCEPIKVYKYLDGTTTKLLKTYTMEKANL